MGKFLAIIGGILRDNCLQLDMLVVRMDTLTVNRSATALLLWSDACSAPSRGVRNLVHSVASFFALAVLA